MNIFEHSDYKAILREKVKLQRKARPGLTLRRLATKIPIQYTYLSKALRDPKVHLNEDHLFSLCHMLEFFSEEIDYLFLLRGLAVTQDLKRKEHLLSRIETIRRSNEISANVQEFNAAHLGTEMAYLFDPVAVVVHVSLFNEVYRENPRRLCGLLGITPARLQRVLSALHQGNFIELTPQGAVTKVLRGHIHYGTDHPMMRVHQLLLKTQAVSRLTLTEEQKKQSIITTFATDEEGFAKLQERFKAFLKEAENLVRKSRPTGTYQMIFDLFQWF